MPGIKLTTSSVPSGSRYHYATVFIYLGCNDKNWKREFFQLQSLTKEIDNSIIVAGKKPDEVLEEKHKRRVDDSVGQLVRCDLECMYNVT